MDGETFKIELGERRGRIPRLPWRIVRVVQPGLLRQTRSLLEGDQKAMSYRFNERTMAHRFNEKMFAEQSRMILLAIQFVDPEATLEMLDELRINVVQFALASVAVLGACGLNTIDGDAVYSPDRDSGGVPRRATG